MLELIDKARHELILENARVKRVEIKSGTAPWKEYVGFTMTLKGGRREILFERLLKT